MENRESMIGSFIDKQTTAFIGMVDGEGYPVTKAMLSVRKREGIKYIYLSTNTSSRKVEIYRNNPKACLYFCDSRFFKGLCLKGVMEVLEDQESKEAIWRDGDSIYYPGGVRDPDYCVLRFTASSGSYYANFREEEFTIN